MVCVIDYGAGNLRSVCNVLAVLGAEFQVTAEPRVVEQAPAILLPGVGHFGQMIQALGQTGLLEPLRERLQAGTPYLGICLGMQALFERSAEAPELPGFGLLAGAVLRFPADRRVPHMGWTAVEAAPGAELARDATYYFAHSYYVPAGVAGSSGTARHGLPFTAVIEQENLAGCQFHPEKSGPAGLDFLRRWVVRCRPSE